MYRRQFLTSSVAATASILVPTVPLFAQMRVNVEGVGRTQIPVMVADFRGELLLEASISGIVRADLTRSGMFALLPLDQTLDELTPIEKGKWGSSGAEALLSGSVKKTANGQLEIRYRVWDLALSQELANAGVLVKESDLRLAAHRIADIVFEKMTGYPGAFASKIAYVTKGGGNSHAVYVADSDGERAKAIYNSASSIISPTWSPDGARLAYVTFDMEKPIVFTQDVASGSRAAAVNYKGSNSAPAWSPDGSMVAVLTLSGLSQIYSIKGGSPKRLTHTSSIDTQPTFSSDGSQIYFVSDRGGSPQIYRMAAGGGSAERVTFQTGYSVDPAVSPDGKWLAYIGRDQGGYNLFLQSLQTGVVSRLSSTGHDASPSFAPNSLLILYTTRHNNQSILMTTTLDGQIKTPVSNKTGVKASVWGSRV